MHDRDESSGAGAGAGGGAGSGGALLAISDLHVRYAENRRVVEDLQPRSREDWLIVAGDVGELVADVEWVLGLLAERFAQVIWAPGNHELWTVPKDPVQLKGLRRYEHLVEVCRGLDVLTPEDPYDVWTGPGGPAVVAPLFVGYDYSFLPDGASSPEEGLRMAYDARVVCTDESLLHADPYEGMHDWCQERVTWTERRLEALDPGVPLVLANHYPLVREPTLILRHPEFALWCGTERTADWHRRFDVAAVVYGHLHIPRSITCDGVPFEEVSLGYPRERERFPAWPALPRQILPRPPEER